MSPRWSGQRVTIYFLHFNWQVEFAAPVGYQEPQRVKRRDEDEEETVNHQQNHYEATNFVTFSGEGNRLDGKKKKCDKIETAQAPVVRITDKIPAFRVCDLIFCMLFIPFFRIDICERYSWLWSSIWVFAFRSIGETNWRTEKDRRW